MMSGTIKRSRLPSLRSTITLIGLAAFLLQEPATGADPAHTVLTVDSLLNLLKLPMARTVGFHETRRLAAVTIPLESEGILSFNPPDSLLKDVQSPRKVLYRVDGDKVFVDDPNSPPPQQFSLSDAGPLQAFIEGIRAPLSGDISTLNRFWVPHLGGSFKHWSLTLTPKNQSVGAIVRRVTLEGTGNNLTAMNIIETNGDNSSLVFTPQ